jgi:hypothetical protein
VSVLYAADDTRFTLKDGIIDDSEYGLQWVPAPDLIMDHYQAEEYIRNLSLAGGGWRLPTIEELMSLYDKSEPGGAYPEFHVSGKWVWSSKVVVDNPSTLWLFRFGNGLEGCLLRSNSNSSERVLAVRSRR